MRIVQHYPVPPGHRNAAWQLPGRAKILGVSEVVPGVAEIWIELDTELPKTHIVTVHLFKTGEPLPEALFAEYLGTVLLDRFPWHVYYEFRPMKRKP